MNRGNDAGMRQAVTRSRHLVALLAWQREAVGELPDVKLLSSIQKQLVDAIILAMDNAEKVEELVELEMLYQELDEQLAVSRADSNSIKIAQVEYLQVMDTIAQMRRSPAEYLMSNRSARKTKRDLRIIDKSKALEQIQGNKTRLRNRTNFASSDWHDIWNARIGLAAKTEEMYRALHDKLVDDYGKDLA